MSCPSDVLSSSSSASCLLVSCCCYVIGWLNICANEQLYLIKWSALLLGALITVVLRSAGALCRFRYRGRVCKGKRVSISNPNSPRDEPAACGKALIRDSYTTAFSHSNCNTIQTTSVYLPHVVVKVRYPPCLRSSFPRVDFILDNKPSPAWLACCRCFWPLRIVYHISYTRTYLHLTFSTCRGPTGKRNTNPEILCLLRWRAIHTGLQG